MILTYEEWCSEFSVSLSKPLLHSELHCTHVVLDSLVCAYIHCIGTANEM